MKQNLKVLLALVLTAAAFLCGQVPAWGEKLGRDYPLMDSGSDINKMPKTTAPAPSGTNTAKAPAPIVPAPAAPVPLASPQDPAATTAMPAAPEIPAFKSPYDIRKPKITVPDYEAKYKSLLSRQATAKLSKKKKTLWQTIQEEAGKYGLLLVLGLVLSIILFTLYKDREAILRAEAFEKHQHPEEEKKNIWKEEF